MARGDDANDTCDTNDGVAILSSSQPSVQVERLNSTEESTVPAPPSPRPPSPRRLQAQCEANES